MMKREAEGAEVLFGVSLSDVARVHAAERTGVSVDERLGEMGLSRAGFARGEQAWLERLAVSLRDDPGLFVAYDEALSEALAKDGPRLLPYEEELAAWVSFEGHLQRALDPGETARRAGLTLAEVARLHGSWAQRLAADAKLAEEATRLRAEEPGALVEVRREPRARRAVVDRVHSANVAKEMGAAGPAVMGVPPAPVVAAVAAIAPPAILGPAPVGVPGGSAPAPMSTGTGAIDLGALLRGPLPFDPNAGPSGGSGAAGGAGSGPAPRATPAFTGTAAVDLSQLRAGPVPFGSGAAPPGPGGVPPGSGGVPPVAGTHSPQPPSSASSSYTGTAEVDVRAILAARGPTPFQKEGSATGTVPPAAPAPPQAAPAPAPSPPAAPPDKPRPFDSGTTDVDPALIAAVLARGAPPFRK